MFWSMDWLVGIHLMDFSFPVPNVLIVVAMNLGLCICLKRI